MKTEYAILLITVPSLDIGKEIAETLVKEKLAACVNLIPAIQS